MIEIFVFRFELIWMIKNMLYGKFLNYAWNETTYLKKIIKMLLTSENKSSEPQWILGFTLRDTWFKTFFESLGSVVLFLYAMDTMLFWIMILLPCLHETHLCTFSGRECRLISGEKEA